MSANSRNTGGKNTTAPELLNGRHLSKAYGGGDGSRGDKARKGRGGLLVS